MTKRVFFYVQHLMGVGHVFRATRIVRALAKAGFDVDLVFGGFPVPDLDIASARIHHLPPLRAGAEVFNKLEDEAGNLADDAYKARRRDMLLSIFETTAPDIIITEAFPFGRRQMRFELIPLMDAAQARAPKPLVIASIRDILQINSKPERDREVVDILDTYFDHVLVHGDPALVQIGDTFAPGAKIASKIVYTGIVAPESVAARQPAEAFDVVVSVGGGALGAKLLIAAAQAKQLSSMRDARWVFLTGLASTAEQQAELDQIVGGTAEFKKFVPDLPALLSSARLSISRAGYNTTADIYATGCRAVVIPLSDGIETEQIKRVEIMAERGLAIALSHTEENPQMIATAIDRAMQGPPPDRSWVRLDGAANTARILTALASGKTFDRLE